MAAVNVDIRLDATVLQRILKRVPENAAKASLETAEDIVADIRAKWSGHFPPASAPGDTPAIRSTTLDTSVFAVPQESLGSGKVQSQLTVAAPYAGDLEYGTRKMAARPFIRPALKRAEKTFGRRFKGIIQE